MAGKSTILRQCALISLMAQMGSFVPAEEAEVCILDQIFTRVGASDYLSRGQSTFMVEMNETANILHNATSQSLVILDEIGRGTSTYDGLAIAWSVAEHLINKDDAGVKTLFATHYHELTNLADKFSKVKNMHVAVKEWEDNIVFLRHLMDGPSSKSYGIQVAALAGVPSSVIERAKEILTMVERGPMEYSVDQKDATNRPRDGRKKMVQKALPLFEDEWNKLREIILSCELDNTTPLKALNMLAKLQEVVKNNQ
jgi:DNA mismatch repair protein MutS